MESNIQLLLHNIGAIISGIVALVSGIFLLANNPKAKANIAMALVSFFVTIFYFSHLIGVNIADPELSRQVLMLNISVMFIFALNGHNVLIVLKKDVEMKFLVYFIYVITVLLAIFYILFPDTFLLNSVPKMYFPNYYVPGTYHWVFRVIYQGLIPLYSALLLIKSALKNPDGIERNRAKFFLATVSIGYVLGIIPVLLVYNIQVDPSWGIWFAPLYSIPLLYGTLTYNLMDVRIIARKAFLYGISVASVCGFLLLFNYSDRLVRQLYPLFPVWIMPLTSGVIAMVIGIFVWKKLREGELLKYEFITVVTHKFRTPLTHIKWAAENLSKSNLNEEDKTQINFIESANTKLVELTGLLMNVSETESSNYGYKIEKNNLTECVDDTILTLKSAADSRGVTLEKNYAEVIYAPFDLGRIKFVIQTFIENAIHYTKEKTTVRISIQQNEKEVVLSVTDQGIGISKEEVPLLFSKFYRGKQAKLADTEGMGIGLFISKDILTRHNGKIWTASEGPGKGSTFSFSLPVAE